MELYVLGLKTKVFLKKHMLKTMGKGAVVWSKVRKMPQNVLAQFVCASLSKFGSFEKKAVSGCL